MLKILKNKRKERKQNHNRTQKALLTEIYYQHLGMNSTQMGVGNTVKHDIVISLTSFGQRIDTLYLTIESLFQQWTKADRIVLWLSRENFPGLWEDLPASLLQQRQRGLDIQFVDGDTGPYKKIIPALTHFPDSLILTVDDDLMYPPDLVDQLYRQYLKAPQAIHCNRAHRISFDKKGDVLSYSDWDSAGADEVADLYTFPTGNAGVLYFPGCFHKDVTDEALFMQLAPSADDIWLKSMSLLNDVPCVVSPSNRSWRARFLSIQSVQSRSLVSLNKRKVGGNDDKLYTTFSHYHLWEKFPECSGTLARATG